MTTPVIREEDRLLTPAEVAARFSVCTKTVTRWAKEGRIRAIRTLGGHRRYRESDVRRLLAANEDVECPMCGATETSNDGRVPPHRRLATVGGRLMRTNIPCPGGGR